MSFAFILVSFTCVGCTRCVRAERSIQSFYDYQRSLNVNAASPGSERYDYRPGVFSSLSSSLRLPTMVCYTEVCARSSASPDGRDDDVRDQTGEIVVFYGMITVVKPVRFLARSMPASTDRPICMFQCCRDGKKEKKVGGKFYEVRSRGRSSPDTFAFLSL